MEQFLSRCCCVNLPNMCLWIGVLLLSLAGASSEFTEEANARLPQLFFLDDYDRCLSLRDGLFCLGTFELSPIRPSPMYERIKEYSSSRFTFNRSRLHRGYCLSERCPSRQRNATVRFERCVSRRAHKLGLNARLRKLHHCTSHGHQTVASSPQLRRLQLTFLQVVSALIALNLIGTLYDITTRDDQKKFGLLMAFSLRANWKRLTATYENGDPRLKELELLNGTRVISTWIVMFAHASVFYYQYYISNPQFLENILFNPFGTMLSNGTALIQVFIMISNFLHAYNMLMYLEKHELSLSMLPGLVIKRFVRIAPVHILVVGFIATWWPHIHSGPFQSSFEDQSATCRRKFWSHVFLYNNLVDKHDQCLAPAWFLPVDMHLYILACILMILMQHRRQHARRLLFLGFIISSIACGVVCFFTGWRALVEVSVPENIRGVYADVDSMGEFYMSSWGSMMACFLGLYMAYLYYDLRQSDNDFTQNKIVKLIHPWSIPLLIIWAIALGSLAKRYDHWLFSVLYIIIDRPAFVALVCFFITGMLKLEGINRAFFRWSGWRIPSRLSLPMMLCHWLIMNYIAARPTAYYASFFNVTVDYIAMLVLSYIIAIPIYLLVETPLHKLASQFI